MAMWVTKPHGVVRRMARESGPLGVRDNRPDNGPEWEAAKDKAWGWVAESEWEVAKDRVWEPESAPPPVPVRAVDGVDQAEDVNIELGLPQSLCNNDGHA